MYVRLTHITNIIHLQQPPTSAVPSSPAATGATLSSTQTISWLQTCGTLIQSQYGGCFYIVMSVIRSNVRSVTETVVTAQGVGL